MFCQKIKTDVKKTAWTLEKLLLHKEMVLHQWTSGKYANCTVAKNVLKGRVRTRANMNLRFEHPEIRIF